MTTSTDANQINPEARARIVAAADSLYEAGGRAEFPTVDAVRRAARADMNTTSAVMKEWRRSKSAAVVAPTVTVPDRLRLAFDTALAAVWGEAQDIANEALAAAQAAWEVERADAEALRAELSQAFEAQGLELASAQERIGELEASNGTLTTTVASLRDDLATALEQAHTAEARAVEIERRADELRAELDRAHAAADVQRVELEKAVAYGQSMTDRVHEVQGQLMQAAHERDRLTGELEKTRAELSERNGHIVDLSARFDAAEASHQEQRKRSAEEAHRAAERVTKAEAERDQARKDAATAREDGARIAGELEALRTQNASLIAALKPAAPADGDPSTKKPSGKK